MKYCFIKEFDLATGQFIREVCVLHLLSSFIQCVIVVSFAFDLKLTVSDRNVPKSSNSREIKGPLLLQHGGPGVTAANDSFAIARNSRAWAIYVLGQPVRSLKLPGESIPTRQRGQHHG